MRCFSISIIIVQVIFFSSSLCELSLDKQDSFLNTLIDYLNSRPDQEYVYKDGVFLKSSQKDSNTYKIDIRVKTFKLQYASTYRFQKCTATILDLGENGITIPNNEYQCTEWISEETTPTPEGATTGAVQAFEDPKVKVPIHLDNEDQAGNAPTSGEQFIAIPRDRSAPCIGCSSHVPGGLGGPTEKNPKDEKSRQKRQAPDDPHEDDPNDLKFMVFAQDSLSKYSQVSEINLLSSRIQVNRVIENPVAGTLYKIYFTVFPQGTTDVFNCYSEVWERPWLNKREVTNVTCFQNNLSNRWKRDLERNLGVPTEKDPKDEKYVKLAQESLSKYLQDSEDTKPHVVVKIHNVTVQVVAGTRTKIYFDVQGSEEVFSCQSDVWERPWLKSKEITVTCGIDQNSRQKRQAPGDPHDDDPNDPKFMVFAQESLSKYSQVSEINLLSSRIQVNRVIENPVAGTLYNIYFNVFPQGTTNVFNCYSEVWERPWLNKREVTNVTCFQNNLSNRWKRDLERNQGGPTEKDPKDEKYVKLVQESLLKYL